MNISPPVDQKLITNKIKSFFKISSTKKSDFLFYIPPENDNYYQIGIVGIDMLYNISNATPKHAINIVHIHSCHSGAAHNYLNYVTGNLILCTYSKEDKITSEGISQKLYENRFQTQNLVDFISNNFHLLAAVNFKISYKLGNKVYSFALDSSKIANTNTVEVLVLFLDNEYNEFIKLYSILSNKYNKKFPEIFVDKLSHENKKFTENDLNETVSSVLELEISNNSSLECIENLLKFKNLDIKLSLIVAIKNNNVSVLNLLVNYNSSAIDGDILDRALYEASPKIIDILLKHYSDEINLIPLSFNKEIYKDNNIFESIFKHPNTNLELYIYSIIDKDNPQIAEMALKYYSGDLNFIDIYPIIDKAIYNKDYLSLFESILKHPNAKDLESYRVHYAIYKNNSQLTNIILKYYNIVNEEFYLKPDLEITNFNNNFQLPEKDIESISTVTTGEVTDYLE
ncbi:hypothetical protein A1I_04750 [Rickettsia bellii OSU 85-389]|nr:hypothetical protein A1I_04750 [Rickettsia bellii OSU 85-389]